MSNNQDAIVALRAAHQHQVHLTMLADQKANINIGFITLVAIFLLNSSLMQEVQGDVIAKTALVVFALLLSLSLVMALLVVVPRLGKTRITKAAEMSNPFYFGMYTQISEKDYLQHLEEHMQTNEQARQLLAADIYQMGHVLHGKYQSLRISYVFLALAVLAGALLYGYLVATGKV